ncbi:dihydropteroate synthase [Rheinheimera sp. F8]|uniref:dihydropteroate synthase n=1 Tax=Rheinheimera sp. F8 TaxID=1763998 RepID=UPI000744CB68|nr:dihydropteroate synthase [Rheinheimera sp. F8]ALZ76157.1 dihydropteroate synthase [Rheinheimera sp. F8]ALZ77662.1 dihydropteroate synthase [Rheinheimera sp. F8]
MELLLPRQRRLDLRQSRLMAILNVTPDSFSDGGQFTGETACLARVADLVAAGADIIDIGGESTRPGAADVSLDDELQRVVPVIHTIRRQFTDIVISVDTSKAEVMRQAVLAGADIINDVRALQEPGALEVAVASQLPVCLMHMQGQPRSMQHQPDYQQVVTEVLQWLLQRAQQCEAAGIASSQIMLDPGFGFGKSLSHNYQLLAAMSEFVATGYPVLAGMSRKSMIGQLLKRDVSERLAGSIACATIAAMQGAQIIRVHDVKETADALAIVAATKSGVI